MKTSHSVVLPTGLSVVVPVYNSAETLVELIERFSHALSEMNMPYEVILVNDGSRDGSWQVVQCLVAKYPWVRGICMMRNYGQHNALLAGIRDVRFDTTFTMDDDLQHPPEEMPKLISKIKEGYDVVYGYPEQEQHGILRDLASVITKIALKSVMGAETSSMVGAFRIFKTRLREAFASYHSPFVSIDVLLTWGTISFGAVRVRHEVRKSGKSNYTLGKLLRHAVNMMTGFSVLPLQMASLIGFAFAFFGMGVLGYVLVRYMFFGSTVAGFPFLASIIAVFSGAQLFSLGIIGEYLARMHFRLMEKPSYCVRTTTKGNGSHDN